ncbi:MAG TPA: RNase P subunit p30 family protein [Candidatus Bathyarchaeia archaeon]|nr:RNase P subunit p30 family protein [Candidatus Bathyarchaeia archaeon]
MKTLTKFVDLHIIPKVDDLQSSKKMAESLRMAGYRSVALTIPTAILNEYSKTLTQCFVKVGLETVSRIDLTCSNRYELLKLLRRFRNQYDLVSVKCTNQNVAAIACRDRRVDIVFFDPNNRNMKFTHTLAKLLNGALELNLSFLLNRESGDVLNKAMRHMAVAREHRVKVVLSSGCTSPKMVRSPMQIRAVGVTLGLSEAQSAEAISSVPSSIIESNLQRRSPLYIEEGVRLIGRN